MLFLFTNCKKYSNKGNLKLSIVEGKNYYLFFQLYFYHILSNSKENSRRSKIEQKNYGKYAKSTAAVLHQFNGECNIKV